MTRIARKPPTVPKPPPATTAPSAARGQTPAAAATGANAEIQQAIKQQDPEVVANLAKQQAQGLTNPRAGTPAKGLRNPTAAATGRAASINSNVDFSKMTQDQQYDYLQKLQQEKGGGWKTGDKELNLVGIRSFSGGKANAGQADQYNDTIYVARMNNGKKEVHAFDGSVDAGKWNDPANSEMAVADHRGKTLGIAHMADGHYANAFTRGGVSGSELGLRQSGWVRAHVDTNNDAKIGQNEKLGYQDKGRMAGAEMQFQFHPGEGDTVGESSAGCQTVKAEQWERFQGLLKAAPESQKNFSYTLTDSKDLKSQADQMAYEPPKGLMENLARLDPINWWNNVSQSRGDQEWNGTNIGCQGRGMVNNDNASIVDAAANSATDYKVDGVEGNNGIGIVRTPIKGSVPDFSKLNISSYLSNWGSFSW